MTVYLDSVFFWNGLLDYILLLTTAQLSGLPLHRLRCLLGALLGAVYAVAVFLPFGTALTTLWAKVLFGVLLCAVAFAGQPRFLRRSLLFFLLSVGFAGCVMVVGQLCGGVIPWQNGVLTIHLSARMFFITAGISYVVLSVVFRSSAKHGGVGGELIPVTIEFEGKTVRLTALCDTGNDLRDPLSGKPVLVVWSEAVRELWPVQYRNLLTRRNLESPVDVLRVLCEQGGTGRFKLITYRVVGRKNGLLLSVRSDCVTIKNQRCEGLSVALTPTALGTGYHALWGGGKGKGENRHVSFLGKTA